jgi:hypothetical protein
LLSSEIESVLKEHGIPTDTHVVLLECDRLIDPLRQVLGAERVSLVTGVPEAIKAARSHRVVATVAGCDIAGSLVRALNADNLTVGVIAADLDGDGSVSAQLRAGGVMDVATSPDPAALEPLLSRALDFSALLVLELAHRCESRRLLNRELELLGQPAESMSDDLSVFQPPALPVGPLSVYNLEEASEAFETAYIDRVQHLCASAREAAVHLGVSSATLSRRLRRETSVDGT